MATPVADAQRSRRRAPGPIAAALLLVVALAACERAPGASATPTPPRADAFAPQPMGFVWATDEAAVLAEARSARRPIVVAFVARYVRPSKQLDDVLAAPAVRATLRDDHFLGLRFDVGHLDDAARAAQERWDAPAIPTLIVVAPDGKETRFDGSVPTAEELRRALDEAARP